MYTYAFGVVYIVSSTSFISLYEYLPYEYSHKISQNACLDILYIKSTEKDINIWILKKKKYTCRIIYQWFYVHVLLIHFRFSDNWLFRIIISMWFLYIFFLLKYRTFKNECFHHGMYLFNEYIISIYIKWILHFRIVYSIKEFF